MNGMIKRPSRDFAGKCKPCATVVDGPLTIALAIYGNAHRMQYAGGEYCMAFVRDGAVYAVRSTTNAASAAAANEIIGTYTKRARADDIAEDVQAWMAGCTTKSASGGVTGVAA